MCGIVGIVTGQSNGLTTNEVDAFKEMLFVDTLRGFDSTGVFVVDNYGDVYGAKDAINGASFIRRSEFSDVMTTAYMDGKFVVGHNRWATRGSITDKNAHPFIIDDNLVLVQNGTYRGSHHHLKATDVDTEAVAHVINEHENVEEALQKIDAAYAFVWYNQKKKQLAIIRNDERPLYIAYTKNGAVLFASEMETILFAASRNTLELTGKPYLIEDCQLLTWTYNDESKDWDFQSQTKLDIAYRRNNHPFHYTIPQMSSTTSSNDGLWDGASDHLFRNYRQRVSQAASYNTKNDSLMTSISNIIYSECRGSMVDPTISKQIVEFYTLKPVNREFYIQLEEYYPGNSQPDCRAWFILGRRLVTDDCPSPIFYKVFYDKTEDEIKKMMAEEFYSVTCGAPIEYFVERDTKNNMSYYAVAVNIQNMWRVHETEAIQ